jgi:hypothetical protein
MNRDELLFLTILYYNLYLLSIVYVFYCNYYHVSLNNFYMDIILATAFLVSTQVYFQILHPRSNRLQLLYMIGN